MKTTYFLVHHDETEARIDKESFLSRGEGEVNHRNSQSGSDPKPTKFAILTYLLYVENFGRTLKTLLEYWRDNLGER